MKNTGEQVPHSKVFSELQQNVAGRLLIGYNGMNRDPKTMGPSPILMSVTQFGKEVFADAIKNLKARLS